MSLQKYTRSYDSMEPYQYGDWYRANEVDAELARLREDLERHKRAVEWLREYCEGQSSCFKHVVPAEFADIIKPRNQ